MVRDAISASTCASLLLLPLECSKEPFIMLQLTCSLLVLSSGVKFDVSSFVEEILFIMVFRKSSESLCLLSQS